MGVKMMIAIIRVRGVHNIRGDIQDALKQLHLTRKNHCVLLEKPDPNMLRKIRDFTTWGESSPATVQALEKKNAKTKSKVYRLNNPKGGWKSTKNHYPKGDLGDRGEKINDLIARMLH